MPTAVWTGTIGFGLVSLPVRLYPATEPKDVRFHLFDRAGRRVRYQRVVEQDDRPAFEPLGPPTAEETAAGEIVADAAGSPEPTREPDAQPPVERPIAWDEVVRGRENEFGEVVSITHEELEQVRPQRSRSIDLEDFVELADIDPVHFEKSYYVVPRSPEVAKPYVLLHRAMRDAGRVGIGRFVLRTKPHLVAVRPRNDVLVLETLFFGDEVRDPSTLMPPADAQVDDRELRVAIRLIETLRAEWNPDAYADTYREELLRLLSEKTPTPRPEAPPIAAGGSAVEELMAALRQSVEDAKRRKGGRSTKAG